MRQPGRDVLPAAVRAPLRYTVLGCTRADPPGDVDPTARHTQRPLGDRGQCILGHQPGHLAVVEDERDLLGGQHEVDRDENGADLGQRQINNDELTAIVR